MIYRLVHNYQFLEGITMADANIKNLYRSIVALGRRYGAQKLVLFGSRARGDNRPASDIDLAVYGMPEDQRGAFGAACEELPTLLKLDIVHIRPGMAPLFLQNIERDGIDLMNKFSEKYRQLVDAVARLREALSDYDKTALESVRDGVIQRFEFCTELAWKTMREYLIDQGYTELNSPKATIRQAFAFGLISDESGWLSLLEDRNLTSHIYNEETAKEIFGHISQKYLALFDAAITYMK